MCDAVRMTIRVDTVRRVVGNGNRHWDVRLFGDGGTSMGRRKGQLAVGGWRRGGLGNVCGADCSMCAVVGVGRVGGGRCGIALLRVMRWLNGTPDAGWNA